MQALLKARRISKQFPGVLALDEVDFDLAHGEIHALLGENGAGKSTLVKIVTGAYRMDSGSISIDGKLVNFHSPSDAQEAEIGVIYQEFSLVNSLSVSENIFLGSYPMRRGMIDWKEMNAAASRLMKQFGVNAQPTDILSTLGVATHQMVEILKVLRRENLKILVMDEPTSSLSDGEARSLFGFMGRLKAQGVSIIYISHRLDEIKQFCDRVTIFKNGKRVCTEMAADMAVSDMVAHMIGSELAEQYPPKVRNSGEVCLQIERLTGPGFDEVSFSVRKGEVLGITGLVGAGKSELVETLFGARDARGGSITIDGRPIESRTPRHAIANGIGLLPESRKTQGLVLAMSCTHNISLASLDKVSRPFLKLDAEHGIAREMFENLEVRPGDPHNLVVNLSGGNQQKVVLAKWLMRDSRVLLFDEPTRGIDVGAKFQIYSIIRKLAAAGKAVIVSSSEIEEISGLCDRVLVMRKGRITACLEDGDVKREVILEAIAGEEQ